MAQQVVTELVIDADTSGADRFESAMGRAGGSAEKSTISVQQLSLAVAGVGVAVAGAIVGLRGFVDYVGNQSQALVDMAEHARLAGISTREFQQTLFAARSSGLTEKDFVSGLDKITANLTAASRGVTEFGRLFEQNGLSVRKANGDLKSGGEALADLAKLMQNASPQVQQAMTRIVGLSASWVPFLRQSVEGIEAQKKAAADLGVIIDDDIIAKAREFNAQWKQAVATWDLQFKASIASIMPLLIKLANIASSIIESVGAVSNTLFRVTTPDSEKTSSQLNDQINEVQRLIELMQKFGEMPERLGTLGSFKSMQVYNLKGALGLPEDADFKRVFGYLDELTRRYDELQKKRVILPTSGGTTQLPQAEAQRNALDSEIDRIEKHIALLKADTEAVGQAEAARAGLRAEAALYAAAERAGFKDLEQFAEKFHATRGAVEEATAALAKARAASDIKFNRQTVGLSQEDVQIAQTLRGLYPDVATALGSVEAQAIRVTNAQKTMADGFREVGKSIVTAFVTGKNVMDALVQSLDAFAGKLAGAGFDNLISGNPMQMGIGALQLGASALISAFTGDQKAKRALEEAQQRWKDMAGQVDAFNRAAAGIDLGPLTNSLMQLRSTYQQLAMAALEARDYSAISNLQETFNRGVVRTVLQFETASAVSSDLANQMKAVADEGAGLLEFLKQYGLANQGYIDSISASIARQQQELRDTFERGLVADIRNNSGVGYLNTIADAIRKVSEASAAGVNPNVLQAWLISTAQTAVNSAKLTGDAFNDMIAQFPQLTGLVHQFVDAAAEASQKLSLQLRLLTATTDSSTLGGALTLFDAKATQERNAALAAGISMENLALLDQAVAAERLNVVKDFSQRAIDEEKRLADARIGQMQRIQDYLNNLTGGSNSTLSPQGRLDAARSQFATQLGLAQGGDQNALSSITQYSDNFLQASRAYNASSVAFQNDFAYVQSALAGLISLVGGTSTSAITGGTASVGGVSAISSVANVSAANGNSWAGVIDAVNSLKAEVVILKAALKEAVDNNTKAIAIAHTEENDNLEELVDELKAIHSSNGNLALAGPT